MGKINDPGDPRRHPGEFKIVVKGCKSVMVLHKINNYCLNIDLGSFKSVDEMKMLIWGQNQPHK